MNRVLLLFAMLALLTVGAVALHAGLVMLGYSTQMEMRGNELIVRGRLSSGVVDFLQSPGAAQATVLRISSVRGDESAAIRVGELVVDRGLDTIVDGVCIGPCALYVFPSGRSRVIEPAGLLACGANVIGASYLRDFPSSGPLLERARRARQLYESRGLSEVYALTCFRRTVICSGSDRDGEIAVFSSPALWIPLAADLEGLGVDGVAGAPISAAETPRPLVTWFDFEHSNWQIGNRYPLDYSRISSGDLERSLRADIEALTVACPERGIALRRI